MGVGAEVATAADVVVGLTTLTAAMPMPSPAPTKRAATSTMATPQRACTLAPLRVSPVNLIASSRQVGSITGTYRRRQWYRLVLQIVQWSHPIRAVRYVEIWLGASQTSPEMLVCARCACAKLCRTIFDRQSEPLHLP